MFKQSWYEEDIEAIDTLVPFKLPKKQCMVCKKLLTIDKLYNITLSYPEEEFYYVNNKGKKVKKWEINGKKWVEGQIKYIKVILNEPNSYIHKEYYKEVRERYEWLLPAYEKAVFTGKTRMSKPSLKKYLILCSEQCWEFHKLKIA